MLFLIEKCFVEFQGTAAAGLTQYRAYSTDEVMSY
jgi:hypothetical protein